jgi:hypothetical protein
MMKNKGFELFIIFNKLVSMVIADKRIGLRDRGNQVIAKIKG